MDPKKPFHELVAESLIAQLKAGTAPWQKPWEPGEPNSFLPMNPTTGKRYKGINAIHLMVQGRADSRWMTYKQATALGAQVRRGERGTAIQYWKFTEEQDRLDAHGQPVLDAQGHPIRDSVKLERPRVFFATVFNAEQIEGLPPIQRTQPTWDAVARAERILNASGADIRHGEHNRAFYRPATDSIHLPDKGQFATAERYYATALHELGHWSGHDSRLKRELSHPFGSEGYAREELRAEIASMLIGDELGIGHDPRQHAAYVASWIKCLEDDPLEIFRAAAEAERIHAYVLACEHEQVQEQAPQQAAGQLDETTHHEQEVDMNRALQQAAVGPAAPLPEGLLTPAQAGEAYRAELGRLLALSSLTPGRYAPSDEAKTSDHAAVLVGDSPIILCGPADDPASAARAAALAASPKLQRALAAAGRTGILSSGAVAGARIDWHDTEAALVSKPAGRIEEGGEVGPLVAVVLDDPRDALSSLLCASTETARVFDPDAPDLGDGETLGRLARASQVPPSAAPTAVARAQAATATWPAGPISAAASTEAARALALIEQGAFDQALTYLQAARELERRHAPDLGEFAAAVTALEALWGAWRTDNDLGATQHSQPAEDWTVRHIERGTLEGALDGASLAEVDGVIGVVDDMQPLNTQNGFWRRHELAQDVDALAAKIDRAGEYLEERRLDGVVAATRRELMTGEGSSRERNGEAFALAVREAFDFSLPLDWSGEVRVVGVVERDGQVEAAEPAGREPDAYHLYARKSDARPGDDAFAYLAATATRTEAEALAERLALIDANSQINEHEKAVKLARIREERVHRDPHSTDSDLLAAKQARQAAEANAMLNDADLQRRIAALEQNERHQQPPAGEQKPERTYISVPFTEKDEAKHLGARWDRQKRAWYVLPGVDAIRFAKWAPAAATGTVDAPQEAPASQPQPERDEARQARVYLAVPYGERAAAKAAGALWDKAAKSWYAGPKADMSKLQRWLPDNVPDQQGPAMAPREEFAEALRALGCHVTGEHPVMDGKKHRIAVEGDKKGERAGFYVGHLDGHPAGYVKNNRTGLDIRWKSKGYVLDPQAKAKLQAEAAAKLAERAAEEQRLHEASAQRVARQMGELVPVDKPTPYAQAKGISVHAGAFSDKDGRTTCIPAFDADGKQWSMQYIQEDGTKRFAKDSRKEGCFHPLGGIDAVTAAPVLVIAEGYATAASLSEALGYSTVAAFDSSNLPHVARALQGKFPDKPILIAGDDDRHVEATQGINPGRVKAEEAAKAVGGKAIFPIFGPDEQAANPAAFTDFNDLATKSALGKEAVKRQAGAAVRKLLEASHRHATENIAEGQRDKPTQVQRQRRAARIA